jgi:hypothetical protein
MRQLLLLTVFVLAMAPSVVSAEHQHAKRWYQERWCAKNFGMEQAQVSKIYDCVTQDHVIEFDYAEQWYEAIGESLYYAMQTGKRAGIVLILEEESDLRHWVKLTETIRHYDLPIDAWRTSP